MNTMSDIPAPAIIVFDMDGTSVRHKNEALLTFMEIMDNISYTFGCFFNAFKSKKPKSGAPNNLQIKIHKSLHRLRRKTVEHIVEPFPDFENVLKKIQGKNIPIGLVSNGLGTGYGHEILKYYDLDKYFSARIFREDFHKSKPNPEPLLKCLDHIKPDLNKDDVVWYIGDRRKDIKTALSANKLSPADIMPIGFGKSLQRRADKGGFDHVFLRYQDMLAYLENVL